jgi:hypothetical protein
MIIAKEKKNSSKIFDIHKIKLLENDSNKSELHHDEIKSRLNLGNAYHFQFRIVCFPSYPLECKD